MSDKCLIIIECGIRLIKHFLVNLTQGIWITSNLTTDYAEIYRNIQGVPGGMCQTSGECSLG